MKPFRLIPVIFLLWCPQLFAEEQLAVGVAANFMLPFEELAHLFETKTTIKTNAVYTSTGNLYGQIINGAPYDIFLAADVSRPERLFLEGLVYEPFIYAQGQAVLWTAKKQICTAKNWQDALMSKGVNRISIANPETAPYGAVALKALKIIGMNGSVNKKLVYAQNVIQSFQYAHTEAVDIGFCALSSAYSEHGKKGCYFTIEQAPVIIQKACILKSSKNTDPAEKFAAFLCSREAQIIKMKFGYK